MDDAKLDSVEKKSDSLGKSRLGEGYNQIRALGRVLKCISSGSAGDSLNIPWTLKMKIVVLVTFALLYFLFPFDIIPDFIPVIGYLDDLLVVALVCTALSGFLETFLLWEKHRERLLELKNGSADLERQLAELKDRGLCVVCLSVDIQTVFRPCGHGCACAACAALFQKCPVCRAAVAMVEKVFIA